MLVKPLVLTPLLREMDESVGVMTVHASETSGATRKHKLAKMLAEIGPTLR